jgi:CBS domain-containing protein
VPTAIDRGELRRLLHEDGAQLGELMDPGPVTVRAHEPYGPLLERMARRHVDEIIVTTPEGELLGVVRRPTGED